KWQFAALLVVGGASEAPAQLFFPSHLPPSIPQFSQRPQRPRPSPLEGVWYFRGDPAKVCFIETVTGPRGARLLFTNENGSEASGQLSPNGRVTIPGWRLSGFVRGDQIIWPSGDFWQR